MEMDWNTIDWLYFGGTVWATAQGAVVAPATFELVDEDGDSLNRPVEGVAFYSIENSDERGPHGWCYARRAAIRAVGFAEPRSGDLAQVPDQVPALVDMAAIGTNFVYPWRIDGGAEIISDVSSVLGKDPVLKFNHDAVGEGIGDGIYIPLTEIVVINTGITDALAEP